VLFNFVLGFCLKTVYSTSQARGHRQTILVILFIIKVLGFVFLLSNKRKVL